MTKRNKVIKRRLRKQWIERVEIIAFWIAAACCFAIGVKALFDFINRHTIVEAVEPPRASVHELYGENRNDVE